MFNLNTSPWLIELCNKYTKNIYSFLINPHTNFKLNSLEFLALPSQSNTKLKQVQDQCVHTVGAIN